MRYILLIFALSSFAFANPKTNLEIILNQIDTLTAKAEQKIYNKQIRPLTEFTPLKDKLETSLRNLDTAIVITNADNYGTSVNLDSISIVYDEESSTRQINSSLYIITLNDDHIVEYRVSASYRDTIDLKITSQLEDESFKFTKGVRIEESSFWDDVWEPAAYVGGAAVIIYLLFTVRSG